MNEITVGIIALVVLLALFFTGLELPFCMILVGFCGFAYLVDFAAASHMVASDVYEVFASYAYTVFPLFILWARSLSSRA
jgi:DMSO/TMAO reductase YedYZ heme-binding membrane subunit